MRLVGAGRQAAGRLRLTDFGVFTPTDDDKGVGPLAEVWDQGLSRALSSRLTYPRSGLAPSPDGGAEPAPSGHAPVEPTGVKPDP